MTKKEALAKELGIVEDDLIEEDQNTFKNTTTDCTYLVLTEEEADTQFYNEEYSLISDLKEEAFSDLNYVLWYIESSAFDDIIREMNEDYVYDLNDESLIEEAKSYGLIDDYADPKDLNLDDLREELIDELIGSEDSLDTYIDYFGIKSAVKTAFEINAVNMDKLIDDIQFNDGRGLMLAPYDGIEREILGTDYYYYRQD